MTLGSCSDTKTKKIFVTLRAFYGMTVGNVRTAPVKNNSEAPKYLLTLLLVWFCHAFIRTYCLKCFGLPFIYFVFYFPLSDFYLPGQPEHRLDLLWRSETTGAGSRRQVRRVSLSICFKSGLNIIVSFLLCLKNAVEKIKVFFMGQYLISIKKLLENRSLFFSVFTWRPRSIRFRRSVRRIR